MTLRVAHLLPNMVTGGRERIVADLCRQAPTFGIVPHIIGYDPAGADEHCIDPGDTPVHPLDRRDRAFGPKFQSWLIANRIDILHAQGHISAALARPWLGTVPMIATIHMALGSGWRWSVPIAHGLRAARAVTAVSDDLAARFRLLAGRPIAVIPTGVDLDRFTAADPAPPPRRIFTLGIAARLHPIKRHEDVIAALRLLAMRGAHCRLVIAGQGPRAAELARLAEGLDVTFDGDVADMPSWLRGLDAFVLASDHEGHPAALLEAMATSLPCIVTRAGGMPAMVDHAALQVQRRSPGEIAEAIECLARHPPLRRLLGRQAHRRAQHFGMDRQAAGYAKIYEAISRHACIDPRHHPA